jgi:hypothetical protein
VWQGFKGDVDYAALHKLYGTTKGDAGRYSPPVCVGTETKRTKGNPDPAYISTSYVERANLTMRMSMRRFTRLTNGFSKKLENLAAAVALHFVHYNYCRAHMSLDGLTPAQASGLANHKWSVAELVGILEAREPTAAQVSKRRTA